MDYTSLLQSIPEDVIVEENSNLPEHIKGLYVEHKTKRAILLNKNIDTELERKCVLAEEIGHLETSVGDITDLSIAQNAKQEYTARKVGYEKLMPLDKLIKAHLESGSLEDVLETLSVTASYYDEALEYYNNKYGVYTYYENYKVYFNPFSIEIVED